MLLDDDTQGRSIRSAQPNYKGAAPGRDRSSRGGAVTAILDCLPGYQYWITILSYQIYCSKWHQLLDPLPSFSTIVALSVIQRYSLVLFPLGISTHLTSRGLFLGWTHMWQKFLSFFVQDVVCVMLFHFHWLTHAFHKNRYFRHASGSLFILSNNLARYININR